MFFWNHTSVCVHLLQHSPEDEDMDKSGTVKRSGVLSPALRHIISPSTDSTPSTVTPSVADSALAEPSLFNSTIFSDLSLSSNYSFEGTAPHTTHPGTLKQSMTSLRNK